MEKRDRLTLAFGEIRAEDVEFAGGKGANLGEMTQAGLAVPAGFVVTAEAYRLFLRENGLEDFLKKAVDGAAEGSKQQEAAGSSGAAEESKQQEAADSVGAAEGSKQQEASGSAGSTEKLHQGSSGSTGTDEVILQQAAARLRANILAASLPAALKEAVREAYIAAGEPERAAVRSSATAEDLADASFAGQQETYLNVQGLNEIYEKIVECYASLWSPRAVSYRISSGYSSFDVALAVVIQEMVESEKAGVLFTVNPLTNNPDEMQINASYGLGESVVSGRVSADTFICGREGNVISRTIGDKKTQIIYAPKGTGTVSVPAEAQKAPSIDENEIKALCDLGAAVEEYYGRPMDIEWAIRGGKVYILQARAITTLKDAVSEKEVGEYIKRNHLTGILRENMSFLIEKLPEALLPLDHSLMGALNNQKANIFREVGLEISMEPVIDDRGVSILPPGKKKIHKEIWRFFGTFAELKDYRGCKRKLTEYMAGYKRQLEEIAGADVSSMNLEECGKMLEQIYEYVCHMAYARFKYSLFPMALMSGSMTRLLKKADKNLNSFDLFTDLNYRTAQIDRSLEDIASSIREDEEAAKDALSGMTYSEFICRYPKYRKIFERFLNENGYREDYNCYCVRARSLREAPDRMMAILRPIIHSEDVKRKITYKELLKMIRSSMSGKRFKKVRENIELYRYFHVAREESQYMWETAYFHGRRLLRRMSSLLFGNEDIEGRIAYFFYDELLRVCRMGRVPDELEEKIELRMSSRPLAERVWEESKACIFTKKGDTLTGVSGSTGEAVGRACIVRGPEEFGKLKKGDILVCQYTDPEWTPLFRLAAGVVSDTGAGLSHAAIVAREYGIPAVLGTGFATRDFKDGDMIRVNGTKGEACKVG